MKSILFCMVLLIGMTTNTRGKTIDSLIVSGNEKKDQAVESVKDSVSLQDIIELSGKSKDDMTQFGKSLGLIIQSIENGNLDYRLQLRLYGEFCTICFIIEDDTQMIEKIYIKPENTRISEWIKRCNASFGECVDIEKITAGEQDTKREIKYMTWLNENHSISVIQMNHSVYIYITNSD